MKIFTLSLLMITNTAMARGWVLKSTQCEIYNQTPPKLKATCGFTTYFNDYTNEYRSYPALCLLQQDAVTYKVGKGYCEECDAQCNQDAFLYRQ